MFFIFFIFFSAVNLKYKEIELKLPKDKNDYDLPLYIEANDSCSKWIPALFSSISIINNEISTIGYYGTSFGIRYKNLHSIKYNKNPLNAIIYKNDIFNFSEIYVAKTNALWPKYCLFGLDYSEVLFKKQNLNSIKNLIPQQIDKFIFSFGKWDLSKKDYIYSKLYIGDSHEFFLGDIGTCNIQNETNYYGCIFNDFIFLNETYSLINENNKPYIIYFSSEFNKIYFPNNFKNKIKNCHLEYRFIPEFICEELKNKDYISLKLRNDNMNITLEVDRIDRFNLFYSFPDGTTNILFHDFDYIIFPLIMFKNFHIQFDAEKKIISFFTNDTNILELKKESNSDNISTILIIFFVILGILLIGAGVFLYKKKHPSLYKKFIKYSRFEEESDHALINYESVIE